MTFSSTRSPAGADCAEPSPKRFTLRHSGYFLSITHSIQIGMDAIPIWMKYPAWSIISVNGAVSTIWVPRFMAKPLPLSALRPSQVRRKCNTNRTIRPASMFSSRFPADLAPNRIGKAVARLRGTGADFVDLTESNPTRVGFAPPEGLVRGMAAVAPRVYDPRPLGLPDARAGGGRAPVARRPRGGVRAGGADRRHERGVRAPVQAAVRSGRRGVDPAARLSAVRAPHAARRRPRRAVRARVPRPLGNRSGQPTAGRYASDARRAAGQSEQPDRVVRDRRGARCGGGVVPQARLGADRGRGVRALPAD